MAECSPESSRSSRGLADGEDAGPSEKLLWETGRNNESFECQELLECQVERGSPEKENDAGLVAEAETVAGGWMLDFLCLSLCRAFRDGRSEDFHRTRDSAEAIIHGLSSLTAYQLRTVYICQFLTRIAAGKALVDFNKEINLKYQITSQNGNLQQEQCLTDAQFETDERITPLESALMIWNSIEKEHDKLHEEIQNLIKIQAIAVCMESGDFKEAEEVFERIFDDSHSSMSLQRKLLTIISQKDTFHSFFQHFSYNHMMEKIKSFVNSVLDEKSSTFLMKAAAKVVESKRARATISQDTLNGTDTDMETQPHLDTGKSVNDKPSAATESSLGTVSLMRSHKNLFLSKSQHRCYQRDINEKEERAETLGSRRKTERYRQATERKKMSVLNSQPETSTSHRSRKKRHGFGKKIRI